MKPNFALSLSYEGIRLLHRAAGGWREVGAVELTTDDLAGELEALRKTASGLEPTGVRSKLIVPNDQIKYLTIDTPEMSRKARKRAAEEALMGATPYAIDELVFDISEDGEKTHIAAVARETLREAEEFAVQHRFQPVSFVSVPGDADYLGEPFFGTTDIVGTLLDEGQKVEPDGIAVVVVGTLAAEAVLAEGQEDDADVEEVAEEAAPTPEPATEPEEAEPETEEASSDTPDVTPKEDGDTVEEPVAAEEDPADAEPELETAEDSAPADDEELTPDPTPEADAPIAEPEELIASVETPDEAENENPDGSTDDLPPQDAEPDQDAPETIEASLTSNDETPVLNDKAPVFDTPSLPEIAEDEGEPAPAPEITPLEPPLTEPLTAQASDFSTDWRDPEPEITPDPPVIPAPPFNATTVLSGVGAPSISFDDDPEPEPEAPKVAPPATAFSSRRNGAPSLASATQLNGSADAPPLPDSSSLDRPALDEDIPAAKNGAAKSGFFSRRREAPEAPEETQPEITAPVSNKPQLTEDADEAERMTVFGARDQKVGGKPRFLGLIMTLLLIVFLAGLAAWASWRDDGIAGLFGSGEPRRTASAPENQITPEVIIEPTVAEPTASEPTTPEPDVDVAAMEPELTPEDGAVLDALANPEAPVAEPEQPDPEVITPQEAGARYAVTGIFPIAPKVPSDVPMAIDLGDAFLTTLDRSGTSSDAIALPDTAFYDTDTAMPGIASPPPPGTTLALDARGLMLPTAEGVLSPDGYMLFAASPPLKPPARPNVSDNGEVQPADPQKPALAGFRPRARPQGFAELAERVQTGGLTRSELQGYRPRLRPASIQEQEDAAVRDQEAERAAASAAAALENPEPEEPVRVAVASSIRPDARPRNFANIVRRATRAPQVQETRTATVAPRTVAPRIPSNASVSRSATQRNAINLRRVNLIGVYGKPSKRRALVRLSNGRYRKVVVGDRIDGGRVSAISNDSLRYRKGSRDVVLKMP